jgi:hypothetical protein
MFARYSNDLRRLGAGGICAPEFSLGRHGRHELQYIPFEHVNRAPRLVIVGITPGNNQLNLAYGKAQELLRAGWPDEQILTEIKKAGAFGGPAMKPNLLKMLRHFHFEKILDIPDVESLWEENAGLLHSTSTVPHAAFKAGKMFAGSFEEVLASPLLRECFLDCFVASAAEISKDALFVGLGPCPKAALEWCVREGVLGRGQVLGSFCHPATTGGSTVKYYLREVTKEELKPSDPVRNRTEWLDEAYDQMLSASSALLGEGSGRSARVPRGHAPVATAVAPALVSERSRSAKAAFRGAGSPSSADTAAILAEVERASYRPTNSTAKLAEFRSPSGQTIYVVKTSSTLNSIKLMVHPGLKPEALRLLDGVGLVSDEYRFHSYMTRFPKRINGGKTETAFGWQVNIGTMAELPRFLSAFRAIAL